MEWVRLYHDTPTDPKWRVIARKSGQRVGDVLAVWTFVLTNASANANERGRTHNLVHEDIAAALDLETDQVEAIISAMEKKVIEDGKLSGWEKRNPIKDDGAAERAKKWRERKRTQTNANERANALDTDTDTDTDTDKKKGRGASAPPKPDRKTSLPPDCPNQTDRAAATEFWRAMGRDDLCANLDREAEKFRDHHMAHGNRMVDWAATWRTWFAKAPGFNKREVQNGKPRQPTSHDRHMAGVAELIGDIRSQGTR